MIQVQDLSVRYATRKKNTLSALSFSLSTGSTSLLLGPSGSGKSTLALCLSGLIPHSLHCDYQGTVSIDGHSITHTPLPEISKKVGYLGQDPEAQLVAVTVEEEVVFGLENLCRTPEHMQLRLQEVLQQAGLWEKRQEATNKLSLGEKQRLALASVLAMDPNTLILDEPTAYLDPQATHDFVSFVMEWKKKPGTTLVLIEHKLDLLAPLVDQVLALSTNGELLFVGSASEAFSTQASLLQSAGIWVPQVVALGLALQRCGLPMTPLPQTPAQAASALSERQSAPPLAPEWTPSSAKPLLEVRALSSGYPDKPVLQGISVSIQPNDFLAIVGSNGAGKSTLIKHFVRLLQPAYGEILLEGKSLSQWSAEKLRQSIGFVFQNPEHQFLTETVENELRYSFTVMKKPPVDSEQRIQEALEFFGLKRHARANPFSLSHGEKRRLSVATMTLLDQPILVLDEPTLGQDFAYTQALMALLKQLHAQGKTIILVTHDMNLVASYARRVVVLAQGHLLFEGTPQALFDTPSIVQQGHLDLPPLAEVSQLLSQELFTIDQFVRAYGLQENFHA